MVMFPNFTPDMISFDNPYNQQLLDMDEVAFKEMVSQMANGMCQKKEKQNLITDWMVKADRKTYVYGYTELLKTDLRKALTQVKVPTLILASTLYPSKDQIEKNYTEQYKELQNKSIVYVEGAAHFIMFDQPETFVKEVTHFLDNSAVSNLGITPKN
jgi:pimeloyl-ACP methyl ester carboxylesterase